MSYKTLDDAIKVFDEMIEDQGDVMDDKTRLDVRDNELYKLILKQSNQREALLFSCQRIFKDLDEFNYSSERRKEITQHHIDKIESLMKEHRMQINDFDLKSIW